MKFSDTEFEMKRSHDEIDSLLWDYRQNMNDTHPEMEEKMHELFRAMSPGERLDRGWAMFDFAVELIETSL